MTHQGTRLVAKISLRIHHSLLTLALNSYGTLCVRDRVFNSPESVRVIFILVLFHCNNLNGITFNRLTLISLEQKALWKYFTSYLTGVLSLAFSILSQVTVQSETL